MTLYVIALCLHVVTAILGVGQTAAVAAVASAVRVQPADADGEKRKLLLGLLRGTAISLAVMLVAGGYLVYDVASSYSRAWWLPVSVLQVLGIGALHWLSARALRATVAAGAPTFRGVQVRAAAACALIAVIAVLMELKPQ